MGENKTLTHDTLKHLELKTVYQLMILPPLPCGKVGEKCPHLDPHLPAATFQCGHLGLGLQHWPNSLEELTSKANPASACKATEPQFPHL